MKNKIVLYTAITGNYETLKQHKYISKDFDYVCFTDQKIKKPGIWKLKSLKKSDLDYTRNARYHKIFPHLLLNKYKYSIWIDSNIDITSNKLEKIVFKLIEQKNTISSCIHFERDCIYQEAKACIDQQKDEPEVILKQVDFLKKEKYPQNNGLFETNIIFREHKNSKIIKLMNNWWWMIENFSRRDQLSFNYVLWKNKINCTPLFPQNARLMSDDFVFNDHNRKVVSTAFVLTKNKFNNNEFVQKIVSVPGNNYKVSFNLNDSKKITTIIFNPLKNQFCQFKINKIKIDKKILDLSKIKYESNGTLLDNSYIDFSKTSDPQIVLNINKKINKLKIVGNINFYNTENLYIDSTNQINNLVQEKENLERENLELKSDLNKIQSSKTYKVWQKFNNIKKIFTKS